MSGLGEKRVFLQSRNGMFPGNQHSLFVPVCKKILNLRVRCLYGNRDENKLLQAYCECELVFFVSFGRGCMNYMLPLSYAWGNFSVLAVGIWATVQRDSLDAITMVSVRVLVSPRLLRKRVEGRVFEPVMIFSCSQYSSEQVTIRCLGEFGFKRA